MRRVRIPSGPSAPPGASRYKNHGQRQEVDTHMPNTTTDDSDDTPTVTYPNTVKHWILYTLDAIEADAETPDDESPTESENPAREHGTTPDHIYDFAAGTDSIVFRNAHEIASSLSDMARLSEPWENEKRPVNRRTDATDWHGLDVEYRYRLTALGREILLDLGVPTKLPNRQTDEFDRDIGDVKPSHKPGWWKSDHEDYEYFTSEWDIDDNDWTPTDHDRLYYKDESAKLFEDRGYLSIGTDLTERFPDTTFVLTVGPHRAHDLAYIVRDPFRKVVQIDIYSPMALHRTTEQITHNFESLVKDLQKGLESQGENDA